PGQNLRQLVNAHAFNPAWSPPGEWIAFSGTIGAASGIFVVAPSGGNPILVANNGVAPQFVDCPTWDPGGTKVAYRRSGGSLLVKQVIDPTTGIPIPVDGSPEIVLISPAAGFTTRLWSLDWSRLRDRIAFEGSGTAITGGIYMVDPNTGAIDYVPATDDTARSPTWSSDNPATAIDETDMFLLYTQKAAAGPGRRQIVRQNLDTGVETILFDHKSQYPDQIDCR